MIDLHERLSEYSYGYGVTREVESLLATHGFKVTPYLPNLVDEQHLGFDVSFNTPGAPVLLQFKLGHELRRFHRSQPTDPIPELQRPFWRFNVDLGEAQFQNLLVAEQDGAEVYYVAPRFATWAEFDSSFQGSEILENSLLLRPAELSGLVSGPGSSHRVVYDLTRTYVCSKPVPVSSLTPEQLVARVSSTIESGRSLSNRLTDFRRQRRALPLRERAHARRIDAILRRAKSPEIGRATVMGYEAWLQGAQLLLVST